MNHLSKQADGGPNIVAPNDVACSDLMDIGTPQQLMQLEKTQKIWDFKTADTHFIGPADNSLPHTVVSEGTPNADIGALDSASYRDLTKQVICVQFCVLCERNIFTHILLRIIRIWDYNLYIKKIYRFVVLTPHCLDLSRANGLQCTSVRPGVTTVLVSSLCGKA
jgi:hypothetical protein